MPAWCGPEQILFIFNQISARIRTELELGLVRGAVAASERWPGCSLWPGRRHRSSQQTASIIHVSPSSVYVIFLPNLSGGQNTPGAPTPVAAKMRTKKAGPGSRAAPPASTDQWEPSVGRRLTNESAVLGQHRTALARELSWWRRRAAPGSADSRTVQRHLERTPRGNIGRGLYKALSLISDYSIGFDQWKQDFYFKNML